MVHRLLNVGLIFMLVAAARAAAPAAFKVTHVSSDHVYINGGSSDGLAVGDVLALTTDGQVTVQIEVVYVARHSASCRVSSEGASLRVNDAVSIVSRKSPPEDTTFNPTDTIPKANVVDQGPPLPDTYLPTVPPTRVSGNLSLMFSNWSDNSEANLDFSQTTARLNLKVDRLWGQDISLAVRTRGRYDARQRPYASGAGRSQLENRLWELSMTYQNPEASYTLSAGRILPRSLGGVGYLDGGLVTVRLKELLAVSAFGGRQPDWAYYSLDVAVSRAGAYFSYQTLPGASLGITQATGFVGEYADGATSRTFLAASGAIRSGSRWGISHTAEVDINSGWRKERDGHSLVLSNLYLHAYYRFSRQVRLAAGYDNRKNYRRHSNRSVADSLFDDRMRQGLRGTLTLTPVSRIWLTGSLGYRHVADGEGSTVTYSGGIRRSGLWGGRISLGLYLSGFDSPTENGSNHSLRSQIATRKIGLISFGYGRYRYAVDDIAGSRSSRYFEVGLNRDIAAHSYVNGTLQHNTGDDIDGYRFQVELGYRY